MLPAVSLDNNSLFVADKISNETADLLLSPEFQTLKLFCSQVFPQEPFSVSGVPSQFFGSSGQVYGHGNLLLSLHPPPAPLPSKGGGTIGKIQNISLYSSGHSPSTTTVGSPIGSSTSRNGSGSNCSMFQTPGLCHFPVSIMMPPTTAGTPVV
jgi:hypothetical protein